MTTTLAAALNAFEAIVGDLGIVAQRRDEARRQDLVHLRRRLSDQLAELRRIGREAFGDAIRDDYLHRLSSVQSMMALHQAQWPAVSIDDDGDAYRRSAMACARAARAFTAWVRAQPSR